MTDGDVPAHLITDAMVDRYLAIEPPCFRATTDYDSIIESIEGAGRACRTGRCT